MADISITATSSRTRYGYGEAIDLSIGVRNSSAAQIFVVSGPPLVWRQSAHRIRVLLGEADPGTAFCYYNYAPPSLHSLGAGENVALSVSIGMPLREGVIDSKGAYSWREIPLARDLVAELQVGYLKHPFAPQTSAAWAEFVDAQQMSNSVELNFHIKGR